MHFQLQQKGRKNGESVLSADERGIAVEYLPKAIRPLSDTFIGHAMIFVIRSSH